MAPAKLGCRNGKPFLTHSLKMKLDGFQDQGLDFFASITHYRGCGAAAPAAREVNVWHNSISRRRG
jgi:hypothetical protein